MVSLIKNQIIKHLSVFAKNLKPDQISLEVLGGTGELRNIVLNEDVLAEKLELPPFLKIRRAECNRLKVKIPWTKLNSSPVKIIIDELTVVLELGPGKPTDSPKKTTLSTSYGFADRVVEGLSLKVNVLDISFESESFSGSLWLSPLVVESKNPLWQDVNNLKKSRISDSSCHQVIFFKQVTWNLMKIQAFAHTRGNSDRGKRLNSPLRLITQGGKCRIAIKKDSNDGSVLAGRIQMIFDDIHWVATLAEIRSFIAFQKHIVSLAKSSSQVSENPFLVDYSAKSRSQQRTVPNLAIRSTIFKQFDVGQTSHHVYINKVYLTLIDDSSNESDYPENWNIKSGAIQVTLEKIAIDFYLQNVISDERRYWVRYSTPNAFTDFCGNELERYLTTLSIGMDPNARERLNRLWLTLTSQTLVIRIDDVIVECVSEQSTKRDDLQDVYTSKTSAKFTMPQNTPAFHFEFSSYFFPGSTTPEPPPNLAHSIFGPGNCLIDNRTIRWLLYVVDNISRTLDIEDNSADTSLVCARIDLLMPKLIIPCSQIDDVRFPERFVVNVSTVTLSNRALENETFSVENIFQQLKDDNISFIGSFKGFNYEELRSHVLQTKQVATELATNGATLDLLPTRWYLSTSPLWIEAVLPTSEPGTKGLNGITVVSDIMLAGCIDVKLPNIYLAVEPLNSLNVVVDHFQFLQFMRVEKSIADLLEQIEFDKKFFADKNGVPVPDFPLALYCFCHEINISVILPVGLAPSPYDLNGFVKSDTINSLSSDIQEKLNSVEAVDDERPISTLKESSPENVPPIPPPPIVIQTRDIEFVDFNNSQAIADDLASNFDESLSMISDDDSQMPFDMATQLGDDIFPEIAEEAVEIDEVPMTKRQLKHLEKNVNALNATLSDFNVVLFSTEGKSMVSGYSAKLTIAQDLNIPLKNIIDKYRAPSAIASDRTVFNQAMRPKNEETSFKEAYLQFQVKTEGIGKNKYAHVIAKVQNLNANIDEQIVSYLGPFIQDDEADDDPIFLELSVEKSHLQIVNPKKRNPLKLKIGQLEIIDDNKSS